MKSLNRIEVIGNLGGEPEMKYTPGGKAVTTFSVATNRRYLNDHGDKVEETTWFNVTAWDKLAESTNKFLNKGSHVFVSGRIRTFTWEDKESKTKRSGFEIVASDVIYLDPKSEDEAVPEQKESVEAETVA